MIDRGGEIDQDSGGSGWHVIASHDDAAALVETLIELDPDEEYTKTELSDAADVPLKSLYLNGTLDAVAEIGLLEKRAPDGEEQLYSVDADSDTFEAARAFGDEGDRSQSDSA